MAGDHDLGWAKPMRACRAIGGALDPGRRLGESSAGPCAHRTKSTA